MRLAYTIASWSLIALSILHMGAAFRFFNALTSQALWFFGGGLLMALVGALNLVNRNYGRDARGLRAVSRTSNVVITAFAIAAGVLGKASPLEWIVVVGIVGGLTLLSFSPAALRNDGS